MKYVGTNGLIESPRDDRDLLSSQIIPDIQRYPEEMPCPFDLSISHQKQEPSCVGHSLATIKQYNELKEKAFKVFDGDWIYKEAKKIDGMPNFQGTYLRSGLSILKNVGAKTGIESPETYKIIKYAKIDNITPENLKKHLFVYGTILAGFTGSNEGWQNETVRAPKQGENTWGHAVALTHYEKNYIIGQNSWGELAHKKGLFKVPLDYMPFEAWVIVLDDENIEREPTKTGWVARNFLDVYNRTTANLNVRDGAGTNYKIIKTLPKGTKVELVGNANAYNGGYWWSEIVC